MDVGDLNLRRRTRIKKNVGENQYCIKIAKNLSIVSEQKNFVLQSSDWTCTKSCDLCITAPGVDLRYNGYFFHDNGSIQDPDQDDLLLSSSPITGHNLDTPSHKINTIWAVVVEILAFVGLEVCVFVIPTLCPHYKSCNPSSDSLVVYIYCGVWFGALLLDRYYRYQHNRSRLAGYLEFYRRTRNIRRLPFFINCIASTVLLIGIKLMDTKCGDNNENCGIVHKSLILQIIISLDVAVTLAFLILYLVKTIQFNRSDVTPDVTRDELSSSFMHSSVSSEIGFRDESYSDQVLEKQADMIRYLKQHNAQLSKRILMLTAENNALKSGNS
ncbi:hypothetical protein FSP39_012767 [Pinctada imbricata]|uniref:Transmembrane protein 192 n=1 Tax=Pinctada imbricata TaxID=66713 RepID=A0AA89BXA6_PINIB|nr:hypothetical protein FSP39_012767 [Pinctada imbricata]